MPFGVEGFVVWFGEVGNVVVRGESHFRRWREICLLWDGFRREVVDGWIVVEFGMYSDDGEVEFRVSESLYIVNRFLWAMKSMEILYRLNHWRTDHHHLSLPSQYALRSLIDYTHPPIIGLLSSAPLLRKTVK